MNRTALLLALCAGCASAALPQYLLDPERAPHPDCPPQQFVVAVGSSRQGRDDAEARARAAVVRQLGSYIQVETDRILQVSKRNEVVATDHTLRQAINEKAAFHHGELIARVGEPGRQSGETYVLACLDRAAAAAALRRDLAASLQMFDSALARAQQADRRGDRAGFTGAYREATRAAVDCLPIIAQIRAVAGGAPEADAVEQGYVWLVDAAARIRAQASFRLAWADSDLPEAVGGSLTEMIRQVLSKLGREAVLDATCPVNAAGAYLVRMHAESGCRWGSLGHVCRPRVVATATECGTGRGAFEVTLLDPKASGTDPREVERALRKALATLTPDATEKALRQALATELPLQ